MRAACGVAVLLIWLGQASLVRAEAAGQSMTSNSEPVWLTCAFDPAAQAVPGFCDQLQAEFAALSGFAAGADMPPAGAAVAQVRITLQGAHRAAVALAVGRQVQGGFVAQAAQQLRIGGADATLRASAAKALVYPLVKMLETLR